MSVHLVAAPASTAIATVTKRATLPFSFAGLTQTTAGQVQDWLQRQLFMLPMSTTRWRVKVRNYSPRNELPGVDAITGQGVYFGQPSFPSGRWLGALAAPPTLALAGTFSVLASADYVSPWCSDPAMQFQARKPSVLSIGFLGDGANRFWYDNDVSSGSSGAVYTSGAGASAQSLLAAQPTTSAPIKQSTLDIRLEYEFATPAVGGTPVYLVIADSIGQGFNDATANGGGGSLPYENWPGAAALLSGAPYVNLAVASSNASDWADLTKWKYARADLVTTIPDAAIVAPGINDIGGSASAASVQASLGAIYSTLRSIGINEVYGATILPDNLLGAFPAKEAVRLAVNTWIRQLNGGLSGCKDFDHQLRVPSAQDAIDPSFISTYPHPNRGGQARLAHAAMLPGRA